ncbi:hypothetical protein MMC21_007084 [Puttea exsequens]|nr:hypothetical protein [Puttea exsequens]
MEVADHQNMENAMPLPFDVDFIGQKAAANDVSNIESRVPDNQFEDLNEDSDGNSDKDSHEDSEEFSDENAEEDSCETSDEQSDQNSFVEDYNKDGMQIEPHDLTTLFADPATLADPAPATFIPPSAAFENVTASNAATRTALPTQTFEHTDPNTPTYHLTTPVPTTSALPGPVDQIRQEQQEPARKYKSWVDCFDQDSNVQDKATLDQGRIVMRTIARNCEGLPRQLRVTQGVDEQSNRWVEQYDSPEIAALLA